MNLTLAIALLLFNWTMSILARYSLTSPYLAGAGALTICFYLQASPPIRVIAVVLAYLLVYLLNEDVDVNQLLARGEESPSQSQSEGWMKVARVITLITFFWLPIPKPPGYLTGVVALLIVGTLIYLNKDIKEKESYLGFILLTAVSVGIAALVIWILKMFWLINTPIIPLLTGLAIPNLVNLNPQKPKKSLAERGITGIPGVSLVLFTFGLAWVTPGLSLSAATSALISPGVYRVLIANLVSVALEGWNLGLIIRGGGSASKTPLANLLLTTSKLTQSPALDGQGLGYAALIAVFVLAVVPAIIVYWLSTKHTTSSEQAIFILVLQAFASSGLISIVIIPLGIGLALLQSILMPRSQEVRSLIIMSPMWV